jgi:hypothetical protein
MRTRSTMCHVSKHHVGMKDRTSGGGKECGRGKKEIQELNDYKELPRGVSEHVHASTHIMSIPHH